MIHGFSDAERSALLGIGAQATGCRGADGYLSVAHKRGYKYVEVLNWSSSAGDWEFIVSKSGKIWRIMGQTNRWPRAGFDYWFDRRLYYGTAEQVLSQIAEEMQ